MENNEYEVQRSLGRIEGNLTQIMNEMKLIRDDHAGLRGEFQKLEAGRLTRLESAFATSEAVGHTKAKNTAMWTSVIVGGIVSVIVGIILAFILKHFGL